MGGSGKIEFANTLQGIAALSVIVAHYFDVYWTSPVTVSALTNAPLLNHQEIPVFVSAIQLFKYLNLNYGAFGVGLFFLVSGFVIPISLERKGVADFIVNRVLRIFPTYVVGFGITLLALLLSCYYFDVSWMYSRDEVLIHFIPGLRDLLWSRNIDGIVWTLEVELKFYIICALFVTLFKRGSISVFAIPVFIALIGAYASIVLPEYGESNAWLYIKLLTFIYPAKFIVFMFLGVVLYYYHSGKMSLLKTSLVSIGCFSLFAAMWVHGPEKNTATLVYSYAMALTFFVFAMVWPTCFQSNRITDFLASISYPLYVIHGVAGYVVLRILFDLGVAPLVSLFAVVVMALYISWVIHICVENPSQRLAKCLFRKKVLPLVSEFPQQIKQQTPPPPR